VEIQLKKDKRLADHSLSATSMQSWFEIILCRLYYLDIAREFRARPLISLSQSLCYAKELVSEMDRTISPDI